ncbi:MAG: bifunctional oligoribonuclease/PAP phosphatase NrnA [Planctomycetes bacterium]|nr:bifunctional oligoribonuclease/PAP phosphatase NrnA [Planctomycetota bacterium]
MTNPDLPSPPPGLVEVLCGCERPVLTTHIYPDGDGVGAELALARVLRRQGKAPSILNVHPAPEKYAFLDDGGDIRLLNDHPPPDAGEYDAIVVLDASDPARLGRLESWFLDSRVPRIGIDHHVACAAAPFDHLWGDPASPATGEMILAIMEGMGIPLDSGIALPLFVSIATDTGWFRFSNTGCRAMDAAARLVRAGVNPGEVYHRVYEQYTFERMALLGEVLAGIRTRLDGRFVWSVLNQEMLERSGVPYEEIDGFVDQLKAIRNAEVIALIVETSPGRHKVSLRSKGEADVNAVATRFGGGGHTKASGYRLEGASLEDVIRGLEREVAAHLAHQADR